MPTSKRRKRDVAVTKTNVFIVQFTRCFGPYRPSSGDLEEDTTADGLHKLQY
jgi:hypothetical protein